MRRVILAAIVVGIAIVGPIGLAPAFAHNSLIASTPSEGETLTELPERFSITTNEPMLDVGGNGFALQIVDAAGAYYGDGCLEVVDATMSTDAALGGPGAYTMLWQTVSADGHSIDGKVAFTWAPTGESAVSDGQSAAPGCGEAVGSDDPVSSDDASPLGLTAGLFLGGGLIAVVVGIILARRRAKNTP